MWGLSVVLSLSLSLSLSSVSLSLSIIRYKISWTYFEQSLNRALTKFQQIFNLDIGWESLNLRRSSTKISHPCPASFDKYWTPTFTKNQSLRMPGSCWKVEDWNIWCTINTTTSILKLVCCEMLKTRKYLLFLDFNVKESTILLTNWHCVPLV